MCRLMSFAVSEKALVSSWSQQAAYLDKAAGIHSAIKAKPRNVDVVAVSGQIAHLDGFEAFFMLGIRLGGGGGGGAGGGGIVGDPLSCGARLPHLLRHRRLLLLQPLRVLPPRCLQIRDRRDAPLIPLVSDIEQIHCVKPLMQTVNSSFDHVYQAHTKAKCDLRLQFIPDPRTDCQGQDWQHAPVNMSNKQEVCEGWIGESCQQMRDLEVAS